MEDPKDVVRFTVGRFDVSPNSMAVVPGHVLFTIDFRHPDEDVLTRLGDQIETICREQGWFAHNRYSRTLPVSGVHQLPTDE